MIIIDGAKTEKNLAAFGNLEEALLDLMQDVRLENRVVTDVLVQQRGFFRNLSGTRPKILPATVFLLWRCVLCPWTPWPRIWPVRWTRWPP